MSFDPRVAIQTVLDGNVTVQDDQSNDENIPVYLFSEAIDGKAMPFLDLRLITSPKRNAHIGGGKYYNTALVDINIWVAERDDITVADYIQDISDVTEALIEENEKIVSGCNFTEVIDTRDWPNEKTGRNVNVFRRVITVRSYKTMN